MANDTRTLALAIELFDLDNQARRLTVATRKNYNHILSQFLSWCSEQSIDLLTEITAVSVRRYLAGMANRGLSGTYQHNHYRALRTFFVYCVRDELLAASPMRQVRAPKVEQKLPKVFGAGDIETILKACETLRDRTICLFLLDSGLRAAELCSLDVGDIDMQSGVVVVEKGKQQKERIVIVGAQVRKLYRRYLAQRRRPGPSAPAFVAERGGDRLTVNALIQLMRRLRLASGIENCSAHTFRRTFATNSLRSGINIYVLAKLMGHSDIQVLRRYLEISQEDLEEAHRQHGPVDKL
ncbi:MAG: tyrosine-type recombinase/integrase [Caldilineaceae bacterium]